MLRTVRAFIRSNMAFSGVFTPVRAMSFEESSHCRTFLIGRNWKQRNFESMLYSRRNDGGLPALPHGSRAFLRAQEQERGGRALVVVLGCDPSRRAGDIGNSDFIFHSIEK